MANDTVNEGLREWPICQTNVNRLYYTTIYTSTLTPRPLTIFAYHTQETVTEEVIVNSTIIETEIETATEVVVETEVVPVTETIQTTETETEIVPTTLTNTETVSETVVEIVTEKVYVTETQTVEKKEYKTVCPKPSYG